MVAGQLHRVRFLLGRAGSGKTFQCIQEIRTRAQEEPLGPPLILLVPEQATYQMDRALLETDALRATLRCRVLSFRRLAHLVLEEHITRLRVLSDVGRQIVVQALLQRHRASWRFFDASRVRPGLAARLSAVLHELRQYRVSPEMLQRVANALAQVRGPEWPLVRKLQDLATLASLYQQFLTQKCYDGDDLAVMLTEAIRQTDWLRGASLWVDSFGDFTKQEYDLLQALLDVVREATFTLCLDPQTLHQSEPDSEPTRLFYRAEQTFRRLTSLIPVHVRKEIIRLPANGVCHRFRSPDLVRIEREMFADLIEVSGPRLADEAVSISSGLASSDSSQAQSATHQDRAENSASKALSASSVPASEGLRCVTLVEASSRRAEVEYAARTIRRLVLEEGWRYRQIAVIVRELDDYRPLIEAIFPDYGIPFFTDQRRAVRHHPVVELVRSALRVALDNWRRVDVVRWLRTDFPAALSRRPDVHEIIDRLEQHADEHGLDGLVWRAPRWRMREPPGEKIPDYLRPAILNRERLRLTEPLADFCAQIYGPSQAANGVAENKNKVSVRQVLQALWNMLEQLLVPETLQKWQEEAHTAGRLEEAAEHFQVWKELLQLLDELDLAFGEECLALSDVVAVLETGLDNLTLGLVPPALDEVLIGAIERSRQPELRGVFLLGLNEGVFPRLASEDPVLNDRDRETLSVNGIELAPSSEARHFQEHYLGYIAFTRASERLWVTYALTDENSRPLLPSSFVERLCRLFPDLKPQRVEAAVAPEQLSTVLTWHDLAAALASHSRQDSFRAKDSFQRSATLRPNWAKIAQRLAQEPNTPAVVKLALQAPRYHHHAWLPPELAQQLFLSGSQLRLTVSELESYAWCPFQFFATSGLRLRPRLSFQLARQDLGQLLHRILQCFVNRYVLEFLQEPANSCDGHDSRESERERNRRLLKVLNEVADAVIEDLEDDRFEATARRQYVRRQAYRILGDYVIALDRQIRGGNFVPDKCELPFGRDVPGSALLTIALEEDSLHRPGSANWVVVPQGRIDRIDVVPSPTDRLDCRSEPGTDPAVRANTVRWIRVVDYKLSLARADFDRIYYGLDMQLMLYSLVASHLYGPEVRLAGSFYAPLTRRPCSVDKPGEFSEQGWLRGYRLRGLLVREAADLFDSSQEKGWSPIVQLYRKRDGQLGNHHNSDAVSAEVLKFLAEHVRQQIQKIGRGILQGDIPAFPTRHRGQVPCTLCALASVCRFDRTWDKYHRLPSLSKDEVIFRLQSERPCLS